MSTTSRGRLNFTGSLSHAATDARPPSVSLCSIMMNEETVLDRFITMARPLVDEIIIVDTGSTDNSATIAAKYPVKLYRTQWQDDFAAPRNLSIEKATSDWILILDPDEYIDPSDYHKIRELTTHWENRAYVLPTRNYTNTRTQLKFEKNDKSYPSTSHFAGYCTSLKTRLFQRRYNYRFEGCFHELLDHSIVRSGHVPLLVGIPVHHYCPDKPNRTHQERSKLYLRLGYKKCLQEPNNAQAWYEYATALAIANSILPAYYCITRAAHLGHADTAFFYSAALAALHLGRRDHYRFWQEKAICHQHPNLTHINFLYKNRTLE